MRHLGILAHSTEGAPDAFAARGIASEVPDAADRHLVNEIIFGELVNGLFRS